MRRFLILLVLSATAFVARAQCDSTPPLLKPAFTLDGTPTGDWFGLYTTVIHDTLGHPQLGISLGSGPNTLRIYDRFAGPSDTSYRCCLTYLDVHECRVTGSRYADYVVHAFGSNGDTVFLIPGTADGIWSQRRLLLITGVYNASITAGNFYGGGREAVAIGDYGFGVGHPGMVSVWRGNESQGASRDTMIVGDTSDPATVHFGFAVGSYDLNHDGIDDLCVLSGGYSPKDKYHEVSVFWGGADFPKRRTHFRDQYDEQGWFFENAGLQAIDVTRDSVPDLLMWTRMDRDTVWGEVRGTWQILVYRGAKNGEAFDTVPYMIWRPPVGPDRTCVDGTFMFGYPVVNIGDINGDGEPDLAVGASGTGGFDPPGAVLIYLGGSKFDTIPDTYFTGPNYHSLASSTGGFDFDGDGIGDFAVPDGNGGAVMFLKGSKLFRPFGRDGVDAGGNLGWESVVPTAADPLALLVAPNPLSAGSARASYTIGADDAGDGVRVTLTDALGRTRVALAHEAERMGRNTIEIDGATIPAGAYLLAVVTRNHSAHAMLVKMR